ncbi:GerAB/ArcD/ProY family transporter [Clostridium guangxiense]|uniref:GerAB/ArcD/ProY family transporter n=1 Tax=Clostridium guangxiense TaxID=1662055 RepID=UPI001E2908BB|nr:GerAB/ArcD/ProY family transporter [Clostridium guangxiense]MCD2348004.1 spore germination protein [Clostridium guangxiense]
MTRLSKHQLFTLMFIFEVGSTTLFALGIQAKQDAWLVILAALLIGLIFIWIYTELQNSFPDKNYVEIIIFILGKKLGIPFVLLNLLGYFWYCARNLREFGELIITTILPQTSLWLINFLFVLLSVYTLLKGVEVLARVSELIAPIIFIFMVSLYILIYMSGVIKFSNLMPILGNGIKPIITTLPSVIVFPFGEMFVFLMYWNYASEKKTIRKAAVKAVTLSGILLCISLIIDIGALGYEYVSTAAIPLVEVIRLINIGNIITNVDAIGIIIIFFGGFFKMSTYLNAIVSIQATLFKLKNNKVPIIITSAALLWFSIEFEPSYAFHRWMFPFDASCVVIAYTNISPLLLLAIYKIKKRRSEF